MQYLMPFVWVAYGIVAVCMLFMGFVLFNEAKVDITTRIKNYKKKRGIGVDGKEIY